MTHVAIRHDAIEQLFTELHESFDSNGPLRVAVDALIPDRLGSSVTTPAAVGNHGGNHGNSALFAVGSRRAGQTHSLACRQRTGLSPKR